MKPGDLLKVIMDVFLWSVDDTATELQDLNPGKTPVLNEGSIVMFLEEREFSNEIKVLTSKGIGYVYLTFVRVV